MSEKGLLHSFPMFHSLIPHFNECIKVLLTQQSRSVNTASCPDRHNVTQSHVLAESYPSYDEGVFKVWVHSIFPETNQPRPHLQKKHLQLAAALKTSISEYK